MPIISLHNIGVEFKGTAALENISFSVEKGEYIGLIGPNGAGKSTLLKVILELIPPSSGTVEKAKNIAFGYVPQNYFLQTTFSISVQEVIEMASKNSFFWRKKQETKKILSVLNMVGLNDSFLQKNFQTLSGGQKQRVIIARSLLQNPDVLLFDEPLSGVDIETKMQVYDLLADLNKKYNTTIIFVSHEIESVIAKCHRVLCLNKKMHEGCHPLSFMQGEIQKCSAFSHEKSALTPVHHHHPLTKKS
jgi:zinc transport system ATP-binding protein